MTLKDKELMTRDDIIEIGRSIDPKAWLGIHKDDVDWCVTFAQLATKKAVEAERKACARVADDFKRQTFTDWPDQIADAIRARSKT